MQCREGRGFIVYDFGGLDSFCISLFPPVFFVLYSLCYVSSVLNDRFLVIYHRHIPFWYMSDVAMNVMILVGFAFM